nr:hypothetical protein [Amycolatopsis sp. DSM 110486]
MGEDGLHGLGLRLGPAVFPAHGLPGVGRNLHDHPLCNVVYEVAQPIPPGNTNHAETSMVWRSDPSLTGPDMQLMFLHVPFGPPALPAPPNSFTFGLATVPQARGAVRVAGRSVVHRERHDAGSRHGALLAVGNCLRHAVDVK